DQAAAAETGRTNAAALVATTSIDARVIDATYGPDPDGTAASVVETLTLELTFAGSPDYRLARAPTVCLTDAVTAGDPAFKPDTFCWGGSGAAIALSDSFRDMVMPASPRIVRLDLARTGSPC